ncbi:MAG: hypothetical protein NTW96_12725 [Planctomycetia bacterium]|nr:hypothetical protein [Planctomycetia bacterium]
MPRSYFSGTLAAVLSAAATLVWTSPAGAAEVDKPERTPVFQIRQRTAEPVLRSDKPWEDFGVNGGIVIREGERWRMWYGAYDRRYKRDDDACVCYAESPDGLHWTKPNLGLVDYQGNKNNNILISGREVGGLALSYVFIDEGVDAREKYKMIWQRFHEPEQAWMVYGGTSADGMHWTLLPEPLSRKNSDTTTTCIHDGDKYRLYTRLWRGGWSGVRTVGYTESRRFGGFPEPVEILSHDDRDPPDMQFYSNAATKLHDRFYVMFPAAFSTKTQNVESHLAWSRDGVHFTRYGRAPVVGLGATFDSQGVYVSPGATPGDAPNTWWFYYFGTSLKHDFNDPASAPSAGGVGRFLLVVE